MPSEPDGNSVFCQIWGIHGFCVNHEGMKGHLQPVTPFLQSQLEYKKLPVANVIVSLLKRNPPDWAWASFPTTFPTFPTAVLEASTSTVSILRWSGWLIISTVLKAILRCENAWSAAELHCNCLILFLRRAVMGESKVLKPWMKCLQKQANPKSCSNHYQWLTWAYSVVCWVSCFRDSSCSPISFPSGEQSNVLWKSCRKWS